MFVTTLGMDNVDYSQPLQHSTKLFLCRSNLNFKVLSARIPGLSTLKIQDSVLPRVHNSKSVQLPYGFCTHHLDRMTKAISSEYA